MVFWFAASPLWWWFVGLPSSGVFSPVFLLPQGLVSCVAMAAVLGSVALFSRRALDY